MNHDSGFMIQDSWFKINDSGFIIHDSWFMIQNQIHLIQSTNEEQIKNQQNVASAVERLKALSDAHHASASNLALAAEQSEESSRNANEGFLAFRV